MKRLVLVVALLSFLTATALAHEGAISLYTDETLSACSAAIGIYGSVNVMILYVRGDGVSMGRAASFRIILTTAGASIMSTVWEPYIGPGVIGGVPGDVSIAGLTDFGCGEDIVPLGTMTIFNLSDPDTFFIKVLPNSTGYPEPAILITDCTQPNSIEIEVLGGVFVFNGSCNVGVEPKSWGAIKSMYR